MRLIQTELAWAAGFLDGEGSFTSWGGGGGCRPALNIGQKDDPAILHRFRAAVQNIGRVKGPYTHTKSGTVMWYYQTTKFEDTQAVAAMLWKYLSRIKRLQAAAKLTDYINWRKNAKG